MLNQFEGVNFLNFVDKFNSNQTCQQYIASKKWENGFVCKKCGHKHYIPITNNLAKECSKCKYIESCTANTLFHKSKIGLRKAFHIIFEMSTFNQDVSSYDIAKRYEIQQKSAWSFMNKVRQAMHINDNKLFDNKVLINDFVFGNGIINKKNSNKTPNTCKIICMVEQSSNGKIKKIRAKIIKNFSSKEIKTVFEKYLNKNSLLTTNTWNAYKKLKTDYQIQQFTKKDIVFNAVNKQLKSFFSEYKKVHVQHSVKHFEKYLNQFCFKINTINEENLRFNEVFVSMMTHPPISWKSLTSNI